MKKRMHMIVALILIELIIMLPVVFSEQVTGFNTISLQGPSNVTGNATASNATTTTALYVNTSFPSKVSDHRVDLNLSATPGSRVEISVNGQLRRTILNFAASGAMIARNIPLPNSTNSVNIVARIGNRTAQANGVIAVDDVVPKVDINVPSTGTTSPLVVNGTSNKPVTVRYRVTQGDEQNPAQVTGLQAAADPSSVTLIWEPVLENDLRGYIIYRGSDILSVITPTVNATHETFTDSTVASDGQYTYRVSAIDTGCNEGPQSAPATAAVPSGTKTATTPQDITLNTIGCGFSEESVPAGNFTLSLDVATNTTSKIEFVVLDDVGNEVRFTKHVLVDTQAPRFLRQNLRELHPSYDPFVTIRGDVSEPAAITVLINGRIEKTENTDANGHFSFDVTLKRDVNATVTDNSFGFNAPSAWDNQVTLIATDAAGNTATTGPETIQYALCSSGLFYDIRIGKPIPQVLNPRLMMEGLQQIGFSFNATYTGSYNATLQTVQITPVTLSPDENEKFDNSRVTVTPHTRQQANGNFDGYAQINFRAFNPLPDRDNATTFEKEEAISNSHKGDCLTPGVGCVRLRLLMETQFQELVPAPPVLDPRRRTTFASTIPEAHTQRTCIEFEVAIDQRIPPDIIPNKLLETLSDIIGKILDVIDQILKPLTTLGTYLIYACFASSAVLFLLLINKNWSCEFSAAASVVGQARWDKEVAEIGACEAVYAGEDETTTTKRESCLSCQNAQERVKDFEEEVLRAVCDRVACPSAPTWQTHVKNSRSDVRDITDKVQPAINNQEISKWAIDNKIWAGNDCAVRRASADATKIEFGLPGTDHDNLLQYYKFYKGTDTSVGGSINQDDCKETLRPAHPACCAEEYMEQWGTACGVTTGALDTFDEIKESMCLAAQLKGKNEVEGESCNSLWNSAAGFCEPGSGDPLPQLVRTGVTYAAKQASAVGNEPYIIVRPNKNTNTETVTYDVFLGYVTQRFQFDRQAGNGTRVQSGTGGGAARNYLNRSYLNSELDITYRTKITDTFFKADGTTKPSTDTAAVTDLRTKVCAEANTGGTGADTCTRTLQTGDRAKQLFEEVLAKIAVPDQEYIVKPDEGILRSIQCLCIPAITSWLQQWKQILGILKTCFDTIRTTGDGSAGACEAFISQYACDLLYEALTCFTQKFSSPGGGTSIDSGIPFGNIFGTVSSAGTEMNRRITGRYGQTGLYQTLFNDRKLANAVCLFAFTGTWNLDIESLVTTAAQTTPIPSQGMIQPCRRRFNGYEIATRPAGLANWVYNMGVVLIPGSDIRYSLELVCSEGFRCNPEDGYQNGECDCNRIGEKRAVIRPEGFGTGQLGRNDQPLNVNIFFPVNARRPEAPAQYRYDRAVLKWSSNDPRLNTPSLQGGQAECSISLEGGDAPAFCTWDLFTTSFRCQVGFQTSKISIRDAKPEYTNAKSGTVTPVFNKDETAKFRIDLTQQYPIDPAEQLQAKKFIGYEIKNHHLATVAQEPAQDSRAISPGRELKQDGDYTKNIDLGTLLTEANFKKVPTAAVGGGQIMWVQSGATNRTIALSNPYLLNVDVRAVNVSRVPGFFSVVFSGDTFEVYESDGRIQGTSTAHFDRRGSRIGSATNINANEQKSVSFQKGNDYTLTFTLRARPVELTSPGRVEILIPSGRAVQQTQATCEPGKIVQWQATFNIYDADQFGQLTNQITTDAATGQPATKTVAFNVMCGGDTVPLSSLRIGVTQPSRDNDTAPPLGTNGTEGPIIIPVDTNVSLSLSGNLQTNIPGVLVSEGPSPFPSVRSYSINYTVPTGFYTLLVSDIPIGRTTEIELLDPDGFEISKQTSTGDPIVVRIALNSSVAPGENLQVNVNVWEGEPGSSRTLQELTAYITRTPVTNLTNLVLKDSSGLTIAPTGTDSYTVVGLLPLQFEFDYPPGHTVWVSEYVGGNLGPVRIIDFTPGIYLFRLLNTPTIYNFRLIDANRNLVQERNITVRT